MGRVSHVLIGLITLCSGYAAMAGGVDCVFTEPFVNVHVEKIDGKMRVSDVSMTEGEQKALVLFYKEMMLKKEFHSAEIVYGIVSWENINGYEEMNFDKRTLIIENKEGDDGMSDKIYPMSARLYFGDPANENTLSVYGGCTY